MNKKLPNEPICRIPDPTVNQAFTEFPRFRLAQNEPILALLSRPPGKTARKLNSQFKPSPTESDLLQAYRTKYAGGGMAFQSFRLGRPARQTPPIFCQNLAGQTALPPRLYGPVYTGLERK